MRLCEFHDGAAVVDFVGRQTAFNNKEDFIQTCIAEFASTLEPHLTEEEWKVMLRFKDTSMVKDDKYVRYYHRLPEDCGLDEESGFAYSTKSKGAFPVYTIEVKALVKGIKALLPIAN